MYQFYPNYQIQQQFSPWYNQPNLPSPIIFPRPFPNIEPSLLPSNGINPHQSNINKDPRTLSDPELTQILDKHTDILKRLHAKDQ
jgi:hypothetical protein